MAERAIALVDVHLHVQHPHGTKSKSTIYGERQKRSWRREVCPDRAPLARPVFRLAEFPPPRVSHDEVVRERRGLNEIYRTRQCRVQVRQ
ncbi:hypothetical protein SKAU_G00185120 [Synaphobranchus kaupii]|uniref:Uncharacterized protein n=1 Tax=Synaphobranchus kaupii TaxID=118154 RepID=A0A9Q1IWN8_SYNKA|nr:hypothetical protein SKAU_G00185120 [Synaphobranchus kaupii]